MKQPPALPSQNTLSSGQLASQTRLTRGALRLYEQQGLIKPEGRTASGYRRFAADTVVTLNAIKVAAKAGFTLAEIRDLLQLVGAEQFSAAAVQAALDEKVREVDERIEHLQHLRRFIVHVARDPAALIDPACDALLELSLLAACEDKPAGSSGSEPAPKTRPALKRPSRSDQTLSNRTSS